MYYIHTHMNINITIIIISIIITTFIISSSMYTPNLPTKSIPAEICRLNMYSMTWLKVMRHDDMT